MNSGARPPSIPLQGMAKLGPQDRERGRNALAKLAEAHREAGPPDQHPFRGVRVLNLQPTDLARLEAEIQTIASAIEALLSDSHKIAHEVGAISPTTLAGIEKLASGLAALIDVPRNMPRDIQVLFDLADAPRLQEALKAGASWQSAYQSASTTFSPVAWTLDCSSLRRSLVAGKASIFQRWFGSYKRASAELGSVLSGAIPQQPDERIRLVDTLIDIQQKRGVLASEEAWLEANLKEHWRGEKTAFQELSGLCGWLAGIRMAGTFQQASQITRALGALGDPVDTAVRIRSQASNLRQSLTALCGRLQLDLRFAGLEGEIDALHISDFRLHLLRMAHDLPAYSSWVGLFRAIENAASAGARAVVDKLLKGQLTPIQAKDEYIFACAEARWTEARRMHPAIERLRDLDRHALVEEFRKLERDRILDCRKLVRLEHSNRVPRGTIGEMGIIRGEIGRKKGHKPIRWVMKNAGSMVQRIKPILLMSPISVAQYLPAGAVEFDLLVIDEASQVRPEDAFGCIARAKQVVVVGDQKQLPPTSFFDRVVDDADDDNDEEEGAPAYAAEMESILTLCEARGINQRMLSWHYRSRDPSLIRVSNAEFYDDELVLPPSPLQLDDNYGLKLKRVAGVYAPKNSGLGRAGTNRIEAEEIAKAVTQHASLSPDLSLGVVAFSKAQSDMITEVLENKRRTNETLDRFLQTGGAEDFFVKNIENVQGDERDVIMISVGYGPQVAGGRLTSMAFGPINGEGGGRRLNVLFSRARTRCEVFTSFDPADLDPSRSSRDGLRILKRFLDFAKTGIMDDKSVTGLGPDSPFEEDVASVIRSMGYEADPQVGSSGFRIDIGVRHVDRPAQYILAVECDGSAYHSALWARERDRLRQEVLEGLGWTFHRIWSTDWFHRREREIQRLRIALESAHELSLDRVPHPNGVVGSEESVTDYDVFAPAEISLDHLTLIGTPYVKAELTASYDGEAHEAPVNYLAKLVMQIVEVEGPIHKEELARRIAAAFGKSRTGSRIQDAADQAISYALRQDSDLRKQEHFLFTQQQQNDTPIRDRSSVDGALLKAEYLSPMEIVKAAELIVEESGEMAREDLIRAVANLFGYQRLGPDLARVISQALDDAGLHRDQ